MSSPEITLESLFREVSVAAKKEAAKPIRKVESIGVIHPAALWTDPTYWKSARLLTLIHKETGDVLGVYEEFLHAKHPTARRLCRAAAGVCSSLVEYVSGEFAPEPLPSTDHKHFETTCPLHLIKLGVKAIRCKVSIHCAFGHLVEVRLLAHTTFAGDNAVVQLPLGANVLPVLAQADITALLEESSC